MNKLDGINVEQLKSFLSDKLGDFLSEDINVFFKENGEIDKERINQIDRVYSNIFVREYKNKEEFVEDLKKLLLKEDETDIDLFFYIIRYVLGDKYVIKEEDLKLHYPELLTKEDYLHGEYYRYNFDGMNIILGRRKDFASSVDEVDSLKDEIVECQDVKAIELSDLYQLIRNALGENIESLRYLDIPHNISIDDSPKDLLLVDEILMYFYNKLSSLYDENKINIFQGETANQYFEEFLNDGIKETLGTYTPSKIDETVKGYKSDIIKHNTTFDMTPEDLEIIIEKSLRKESDDLEEDFINCLKEFNNTIELIKMHNPNAFENVDISTENIRRIYMKKRQNIQK